MVQSSNPTELLSDAEQLDECGVLFVAGWRGHGWVAVTTVMPKVSKISAQGVPVRRSFGEVGSPGEIGFCESRPVSGGRSGVVTHAKDLRKRHVGALGNEPPYLARCIFLHLPRASDFAKASSDRCALG